MLSQALRRFGSHQVRASSAIGAVLGATDISPALSALHCKLLVARGDTAAPPREIGIGARQKQLDRTKDVIVALLIPMPPQDSVATGGAGETTAQRGGVFCTSCKSASKRVGAAGVVTLALQVGATVYLLADLCKLQTVYSFLPMLDRCFDCMQLATKPTDDISQLLVSDAACFVSGLGNYHDGAARMSATEKQLALTLCEPGLRTLPEELLDAVQLDLQAIVAAATGASPHSTVSAISKLHHRS